MAKLRSRVLSASRSLVLCAAVTLAGAALTLPDGRVAHADEWCGPGYHSTGWGDNGDGIVNVGDNFYCVPDIQPTSPPTTKPKPVPTTTAATTTTVLATTTTTAPKPADPCAPDETADACDQDDDGLTNAQEKAAGTDPTKADTDDDGVADAKDKDNTTPDGATVDEFGVEVTVTTTAAPTTTPAESSDSSSSAGVIAGAAGGVVLLGGLLVLLRRRKGNTQP